MELSFKYPQLQLLYIHKLLISSLASRVLPREAKLFLFHSLKSLFQKSKNVPLMRMCLGGSRCGSLQSLASISVLWCWVSSARAFLLGRPVVSWTGCANCERRVLPRDRFLKCTKTEEFASLLKKRGAGAPYSSGGRVGSTLSTPHAGGDFGLFRW